MSEPSWLERAAPWCALVVVPSAFLANLSAAYALVPLACITLRHGLVHIAPAAGLVVTLAGIALSAWSLRRARSATGTLPNERHFLSAVSLAVAALFLLATLTQWYVAVALSPCQQ
jgi:hypothetical protein